MLVFIIAAIKFAQTIGVYGGAALTGAAEKGLKYPFVKAQQYGQALGNQGKEFAQEKYEDRKLKFKTGAAEMAAGGSRFKRGLGKTVLVGDYLAAKKHIREEERKPIKEKYEATLHDAAHIKDGVVPTTARAKLDSKEENEFKKELDGKTVKEILDMLEEVRAGHKSDQQKRGAELAVLTELAKRKEFDTLLKHENIEGNDDRAVTRLLQQLVDDGRIDAKAADRYAGRLDDIFSENKQFQ